MSFFLKSLFFSFLFVSQYTPLLSACDAEASLESSPVIIRQSKESYLEKHKDDAFLLIGCGHFTPNDSDIGTHPVHDKNGNKIGEITENYYSSNFWGDYDFHEHPGIYTVDVNSKLNSDIVGAIGNPKVDSYLFCDPVWKVIYPECTSMLLTESFLKNVAQGLCEGGVFVTSLISLDIYPFLKDKKHLFENLSRAESEGVLKNLFKEYGFSDVKLHVSPYFVLKYILAESFSKKFENEEEKKQAYQDFLSKVFRINMGEEIIEVSFTNGIETINPEASACHPFFNYVCLGSRYLIAKK